MYNAIDRLNLKNLYNINYCFSMFPNLIVDNNFMLEFCVDCLFFLLLVYFDLLKGGRYFLLYRCVVHITDPNLRVMTKK